MSRLHIHSQCTLSNEAYFVYRRSSLQRRTEENQSELCCGRCAMSMTAGCIDDLISGVSVPVSSLQPGAPVGHCQGQAYGVRVTAAATPIVQVYLHVYMACLRRMSEARIVFAEGADGVNRADSSVFAGGLVKPVVQDIFGPVVL